MFYLMFALVIGSFLNVLIYRIPRGESIVFPPSHCPFCRHRLVFFDLIPVLSYLWLKGRCRYCHSRINPRYPLVELLTVLLTCIWSARYNWDLCGLALLVFIYLLLVIGFIDYEHKLIPNTLVYPTIIFVLLYRLSQGQLGSAIVGGLVAGGLLFVVVFLYPQGMGMGDVKLMTLAGVLLGWEQALSAIFIAAFLGTIGLLPLFILKRITRKTQVPFGPFLVLALFILIFWRKTTLWSLFRGGSCAAAFLLGKRRERRVGERRIPRRSKGKIRKG